MSTPVRIAGIGCQTTTWPFQAVPFALAAAPLRTLALVVDDPA
jgi:hypothetical protein